MNRKRRASSLKYKDMRLGREFSFKRRISKEDVICFARLTGDFNPLHLEDKFARNSGFDGPIVHGMLVSALFSTLVGMYCPGRNALILSQEVKYIKPVKPGDRVVVCGRVTNKIDSVNVLIVGCRICRSRGEVLVEGVVKVKVMR